MAYTYGRPLTDSGKVISVEHREDYSFITLDGHTWNVVEDIPDSVWMSLSRQDKDECFIFTEDAYSEWLWSNQHE